MVPVKKEDLRKLVNQAMVSISKWLVGSSKSKRSASFKRT